MEHKGLVSVILPFLNEQEFLGEAVDSVIAQDYREWELLLVDDGSSDDSTSLARQYADRYPDRIRYLEHEGHANKGLSASRNLGLTGCRGEFIALIDADDKWKSQKLSHQVDLMNRYPEAGMTCGPSLYWHSWTTSSSTDIIIPVGVPGDKLYFPPMLALKLYPLGKGAAPCPCSLLLRRGMPDQYGRFEEEGFRGIYQMYEDQPFLAKVYLHVPVFVSGVCQDLYRQRPASLVAGVHRSGNYPQVRRHYLEWFGQYLLENNIRNRAIRRALRRAMLPMRFPLLDQILKFAYFLRKKARSIKKKGIFRTNHR
ncbi:MAG TPA: glycosyltransferase [Chitinophagaceae bacterium]|nr:glycosyltransferase [Chitinophagaceae bacterium]